MKRLIAIATAGLMTALILTGCTTEPEPTPTATPKPTSTGVQSFDSVPIPEEWSSQYASPLTAFDDVDTGKAIVLTAYKADINNARTWTYAMVSEGWGIQYESDAMENYSAMLIRDDKIATVDSSTVQSITVYAITELINFE